MIPCCGKSTWLFEMLRPVVYGTKGRIFEATKWSWGFEMHSLYANTHLRQDHVNSESRLRARITGVAGNVDSCISLTNTRLGPEQDYQDQPVNARMQKQAKLALTRPCSQGRKQPGGSHPAQRSVQVLPQLWKNTCVKLILPSTRSTSIKGFAN